MYALQFKNNYITHWTTIETSKCESLEYFTQMICAYPPFIDSNDYRAVEIIQTKTTCEVMHVMGDGIPFGHGEIVWKLQHFSPNKKEWKTDYEETSLTDVLNKVSETCLVSYVDYRVIAVEIVETFTEDIRVL